MANLVNLVGELGQVTYDHTMYGEDFYHTTLEVKRDSGKADIVPLIISERLMEGVNVGDYVHVSGEFRSYNKHDEDKNRLKLYVFVNALEVAAVGNVNDVFLEGYLCKTPTYRHTPQGREIADVILAVNRGYNKSDYIPCICWGRSAYFVRRLEAGDGIRVAGRIQSRDYVKNGETKTAYELSVNLLEVC